MSKKLIRSGLLVSGATLASRILGLVRDIVIANLLGAGAAADVFFFANRIPNYLRRLFADGAFNQAFVPVMTEYKAKGDKQAVRELLAATMGTLGAIISVDTDRTIRVEGVSELNGYSHTSLPDRIEAGSWASAALATRGDIYVHGAHQQDMTSFLNVFRKVGGAFEIDDDGIRFWHPGGELNSISLQTDVHPGFMTDWQQPMVVALTQATGISILHETVYENRLGFTEALVDMGAHIQTYRECLGGLECRFGQRNFYHSAVIQGPTALRAADIEVPDLRAGFSYLIAALAAKGTSIVSGTDVIDRGYEHFMKKLHSLGANVQKLS